MGVKFLELKNFNGLMSVWGGLNTVFVHRLKKTKKKLPKSYLSILQAFEKQLCESNNFQRLRAAMEKYLSLKQPIVPWFELISKNRNWVNHYHDYLQIESEEKMWNFMKMFVLGSQIINFCQYQNVNSVFDLQLDESHSSNVSIRSFLEHLPVYSDDKLWKLSLRCEKI